MISFSTHGVKLFKACLFLCEIPLISALCDFQAIQNKLKEVRAEANAERSRLTATTRQLEEKLSARTTELAAATAKFQHEKQNLAQQIQQVKHLNMLLFHLN